MSDFLKEYRKSHELCPQCGTNTISRSNKEFPHNEGEEYRDRNQATCKQCGWQGIVHDLVADFENTRLSNHLKTIKQAGILIQSIGTDMAGDENYVQVGPQMKNQPDPSHPEMMSYSVRHPLELNFAENSYLEISFMFYPKSETGIGDPINISFGNRRNGGRPKGSPK